MGRPVIMSKRKVGLQLVHVAFLTERGGELMCCADRSQLREIAELQMLEFLQTFDYDFFFYKTKQKQKSKSIFTVFTLMPYLP